MRSRDPYELLGVSREASTNDVRRAYRGLARTHHPDANPDDPGAEERFKELYQAYDTLSNPEKRRNNRNNNQRFSANSQRNRERPRTRGGGRSNGSDAFQVDLADLYVRRRGSSARRQEADRKLRGEDVSRLAKLFGMDLDRFSRLLGEGARDLREG